MEKPYRGALSGSAFLMAVSAIGPGFLTQTTQFTAKLGASLSFAILVSILIDIGAQLNTWRAICISGKRGHELADDVLPGLGRVVTGVIVFGSFAFNIGNVSGCALALQALFGMGNGWGATVSAVIVILLFLVPRMGIAIDRFSKLLGVGMIVLIFYIVLETHPPLSQALVESVAPRKVDFPAIITLVGGTVGGYVMFSGAHRLLDAGCQGVGALKAITWASVSGIVITGIMRSLLFLAVLGVIQLGAVIGPTSPVFDAFRSAAGPAGYIVSALVFWLAAVTSVVGCSYTSVSFLANPDERITARRTVLFICLTLLSVYVLQATEFSATSLLIAAGTLNGALMPVLLGVALIAVHKRALVGEYRHPRWATLAGVGAWVGSVYLAYRTVAALAV
ncbi:MAG: divalent metal cation transporter [Acidobacteria bacterium]|nr:divalent metal cation transporter [Acidobacteriota bacterium]